MMKKLNITNLVDDCTISGGGLMKISKELDRLYEIEKRVGDEKLYEIREIRTSNIERSMITRLYIGKKEFKSKLIQQLKEDVATRDEELEDARVEIRGLKDSVSRHRMTISFLEDVSSSYRSLLDENMPKKKRFKIWGLTAAPYLKIRTF